MSGDIGASLCLLPAVALFLHVMVVKCFPSPKNVSAELSM